MSNQLGPGGVLVTSVVEALYIEYRGLEDFRGADLGYRRRRDGTVQGPVLRLHLAATEAGERSSRKGGPALPRTFGGLPLELRRVNPGPDMAAPALPQTHHVTGGTPCSPLGPGVRAAGQVTLMACGREAGQIGFVTSLASVGGVAGRRGTPVYRAARGWAGEVPGLDPGRDPVAKVTATCCGRAGLAGFASLEPGQPWLPLERPENLAITSLRRPVLGDVLRAASGPATVEGVGIYRILTLTGDRVDVDGFRTRGEGPLPSGALVYDELRWSGVGLATVAVHEPDGATYTLSCEIARVMAALNLRLASYDDLVLAAALHQPQAVAPAVAAPASGPRPPSARRVDAMLGDPRDAAAAGATEDDYGPNRRPDIVTMIWPPLRRALARAGAPRPHGITDRVERLDPTGRPRARLIAAINASEGLAGMGLRRVEAADFRDCVTFDQVCERIVDILATFAGHPFR